MTLTIGHLSVLLIALIFIGFVYKKNKVKYREDLDFTGWIKK
jgi:hypothetical protein